MGVYFYLLPKAPVGCDAVNARRWLDYETRQFGEIPSAVHPPTETRKRKLANLVLETNPNFEEFDIRYEQIAEFEKISVDEARLKYRYIEINGSSVQFTIYDRYIAVGVYSTMSSYDLDSVFAALSVEGGFVLYDPQLEKVVDLLDRGEETKKGR